ncbi:pentapeptide repeat protein [Crinalium epipsammum PCC 9333]|uniref:Pentapeptide repeat protein n=1 Tax=Crinalium epipsammum PCC 9333 TaxID=1173022 RepID=K9VW38_9CYAN|nr:pentapeptide repeat-containing protein [Crinalium epipsammum]AFZ11779.1 pentapeptide repeat protein [Crinalium epipsammum PCC 9333]
MKVTEVLERYQAGERDFRRLNLRGQSFQGQNLSGGDFSECDIRSTDFSKANLREAKFCDAKAGLQRRWAMGLIIASWLVSGVGGSFSAFVGSFVILTLDSSDARNFSIGIACLVTLMAFFSMTIQSGLVAGALAGAVAVAVVGTVAVVGALAVTGAVAGALATEVAGALAVTLAGAVAVTVALAVARAVALAVAGALTRAVALAVAVAVAVAVAGTLATEVAVALNFAVAVAVALAVAGAIMLLSAYIGWRAFTGNEKDAWVRSFAFAFAATGGTSFRGANLSDANFNNATLKSTDFRNAILTRTCFHQTKLLERVRSGTTYLRILQLSKLLITGQGQGKNFERLNLQGINLKGANLADASFIGSDLSEANLQDADLSRAYLKQTQLDGTDFTGATLTGAYIEDWGITRETKFDGVRCKHVYMRVPTKENPDPYRKPDNNKEVFQDGEFGDFIKPILDTLDLYHNQGVDPRAIAISFKHLVENHPEAELEIVAMEKRGKDKFLIRTKTGNDFDRSALSQEYFASYNRLKGLPSNDSRLLIAEKDIRIASLENMVMTVLNKPTINTNTYQHQGDIMPENQGSINISGVQGGSISGLAAAGGNQEISGSALGDISGTVTNTIGQLEQADESEAPKLADLLKQLQTAIETDSNLTPETKIEALEQINALAEAGKNPKEGTTQKAAKTALTMLKGIIADLPAIATVVEAGKNLLPVISQFFGLV